ncbi:MAG: cysteine peptidase family C39 domain-containing protein, partial [Leptodesmis sp.]|uniref:cysteine peptidase family C39 domain-containing protein n=1 Tax=Leptodesmis sp. TaxID=3100501 RepID=UPI003D0D9454
MIANDLATDLPWNIPPLSLLNPEQQVQFKQQAEIRRFSLGEMIWATDQPGMQAMVMAGKVRLVPEEGQSVILKSGDWLGDLLHLPGFWKARAADKDVVVVVWRSHLWTAISSTELERFWAAQRFRCLPKTADTPQPVTGFPFVAGVNTGAACLTMVANHLQNSTQLEWVQRQLRSQSSSDVMEAAEKVGLQLRHVKIDWSELRLLGLPALMLWQDTEDGSQERPVGNGTRASRHWVVVYAVKGDRLIIADPLNPNQTCESIPRAIVEASWDGQLWQAETIQKQDRFSLAWFLPAVWKYRLLLSEVLLASFTLQVLGLASPIITQVVIDKVMVQGSLSTLDVMAFALLAVAFFEAILG